MNVLRCPIGGRWKRVICLGSLFVVTAVLAGCGASWAGATHLFNPDNAHDHLADSLYISSSQLEYWKTTRY